MLVRSRIALRRLSAPQLQAGAARAFSAAAEQQEKLVIFDTTLRDGEQSPGARSRARPSLTHCPKPRRKIRQNILWALGYNLLILPFAVSGLLLPWMAVIGMSLSSIIVVSNSTRLLK